ncbi:MAG: hypothetical protein HYT98_04510 [Candidatus Sungbacteria bacterium]|nr:hypothetical protein [Candidatus Sungbacteria bacterium]
MRASMGINEESTGSGMTTGATADLTHHCPFGNPAKTDIGAATVQAATTTLKGFATAAAADTFGRSAAVKKPRDRRIFDSLPVVLKLKKNESAG